MSRISKIPRKSWAPELAVAYGEQDASELQLGLTRMFAHKPAAAVAVMGLMRALRQSRELSDRLIELVRLRIAFHNQCRSCMAVRYRDADGNSLDQGLVCSLERPMEAPGLLESERAALAYADLFANDHLSIDASTYDGLRRLFHGSPDRRARSELRDVRRHRTSGRDLGYGRGTARGIPGSFEEACALDECSSGDEGLR